MNTPVYKFAGFWLAVAMVLLMLVNFVRTLRDPTGFSAYMGLPIKDAGDLAWVQVYGLRALFIGLVAAFFLIKVDPASLKWVTALAIVMALGDAWLVSRTGNSAVTRHLTTAGVLMLGTYALHRWDAALTAAAK
ncbi:MAG: DUF4267 domain-containing protein [Rhizobacter sp.]